MDSADDVAAQIHEAGMQGRHAEARALLQDGLSRFPDSPDLLLRRAAEILDDPEEAKRCLYRASELAPADPELQYQIGRLLLDLGEVDDAFACAERKGLDDLAESALTMAFEMEPDFFGHAYSLAAFLSKRGRTSEALQVIADGLEQLPDDPQLTRLRDQLASG